MTLNLFIKIKLTLCVHNKFLPRQRLYSRYICFMGKKIYRKNRKTPTLQTIFCLDKCNFSPIQAMDNKRNPVNKVLSNRCPV